ncbi:hypothetical protein [Saguinine gammaherpesvirus 1]|uniref:Uncharacterized protein n=1 Tax=Saguinine gammaherpesvirus 1 TaxID=2169901 RepID=A0A9Q8VIR4_9GAMA|nr:hypothetical protein [Saguinine gammaherpesvirus 1]
MRSRGCGGREPGEKDCGFTPAIWPPVEYGVSILWVRGRFTAKDTHQTSPATKECGQQFSYRETNFIHVTI